ncbi:hypothetical protein [Flaviflexus ciconiae]|uniref:hypothetical protein n=1 Tax=Flaviflexus ciconiae TaxID=2496867 RepID=UPI0019D19211|nr:hypothetical protein [Flaviflexus ciconiae]
MKTLSPTVLIVGAGPAGLTAAAELGKSLGERFLSSTGRRTLAASPATPTTRDTA